MWFSGFPPFFLLFLMSELIYLLLLEYLIFDWAQVDTIREDSLPLLAVYSWHFSLAKRMKEANYVAYSAASCLFFRIRWFFRAGHWHLCCRMEWRRKTLNQRCVDGFLPSLFRIFLTVSWRTSHYLEIEKSVDSAAFGGPRQWSIVVSGSPGMFFYPPFFKQWPNWEHSDWHPESNLVQTWTGMSLTQWQADSAIGQDISFVGKPCLSSPPLTQITWPSCVLHPEGQQQLLWPHTSHKRYKVLLIIHQERDVQLCPAEAECLHGAAGKSGRVFPVVSLFHANVVREDAQGYFCPLKCVKACFMPWFVVLAASRVTLVVKSLCANAGDARDMGLLPEWEDPLEKGKAIHSSIFAGEILWTEEPDGKQSIGLQRVGHN